MLSWNDPYILMTKKTIDPFINKLITVIQMLNFLSEKNINEKGEKDR